MYFINDNYRILYNSRNKEACAINQKEGIVYNIEWKIFLCLYYLSKYDRSIARINFKDKDIIENLIEEITQKGIIYKSTHKNKRFDKVCEEIDYNILSTVQIEITRRCNLRCKHCYLGTVAEVDMELEAIKEIVDDAIKLGACKIAITGGEPLLHSDIKELLAYIKEKQIYIEIFTNGTLLDDQTCQFLGDMGIGKVFLSLDGHVAKVHDKIRDRDGAFDKAMRAIAYLKKYDIDISVACTFNRLNIKCADEIVEFLEDLEVPYKLDCILMEGNAKEHSLELALNYKEYAEIASTILEKHYGKLDELGISGDRFCGSGYNFIYITVDGKVKICPSISDKFTYGNIFENSLYDIWKENYSKYLPIKCRDMYKCEFANVCCGGCRSRAYTSYHDINARDAVMCDVLKIWNERRCDYEGENI